ncbi:MAG: PIG-L deacetylase family protein, partial [Candidatus Geothermincolia bacterium]
VRRFRGTGEETLLQVDKILKKYLLPHALSTESTLDRAIRVVSGAAVVLLTLFLIAVLYTGAIRQLPIAGRLSSLEYRPLGEKLLIVAPHPDDEALPVAGLIQEALSEHRQVKVVVILSGESGRRVASEVLGKSNIGPVDYQLVGMRRLRESKRAMALLKLPPSDLIFLGYPDGALNSLWERNWDFGNPHRGFNGSCTSPYSVAYQRAAPYCGENVVRNLSEIIKKYRPSSIIYPNSGDYHHDHWAASAFMQYVLARTGYRAHEYTYIVHTRDFPWPEEYLPKATLDPPTNFDSSSTTWETQPLTLAEQQAKDAAISKYKIPSMVRETLLKSFARTNELLAITGVPRIKRPSTAPDPGAAKMPCIVDADPPGDSARYSPVNGGELESVSLCISGKTLWVGVGTVGKPSDGVTYRFHMRGLGGRSPVRADVVVRNGKASYARQALNSFVASPAPRAHMLVKRVWIEMPSSFLKGQKTMMLGIDSIVNNKPVDSAPWRSYAL